MTRTVFYGFGAYVGTISGPTTCAFWPDDPQRLGWATAAQVAVDLAKNVSAARAGTLPIADIQVDDHRLDGGMTVIGPRFFGGQTLGAVWLSEQYYTSLATNRPPRQPPTSPDDAHDYELTSILYWDGPLAGRRFHGFHASVVSKNGPLTKVELWHAGTGKVAGQPSAGTWWLDLAASAHPIDPAATQVDAQGSAGALFLDAPTTRQLTLRGPKRPESSGADYFGAPTQRTPRA